jgi:hypothetical protein
MFRREPHRLALAVLSAVDAGLLERTNTLFAGGTRLVLEFEEYRESEDLDFLCAAAGGYAELRALARRQGPAALFAPDRAGALGLPREARTDQYGVRFPVTVEGRTIKFEVVREARLELAPGDRPLWSPVPCLALVDCYAEKLLANSDRWADLSVLSRDLIDLSVLRARAGEIPVAAWAKAEGAYGRAVQDDLGKALRSFLDHPDQQRRCFVGLGIDRPEAILSGVAALLADLGDPPPQSG